MATNIFARIGDIKGESTDAKHPGEIEVPSLSWGVTNTPPADPGAALGGASNMALVSPNAAQPHLRASRPLQT